MASTPTAAHLRLVAVSMRRLATRIDDVRVGAARSLAGADTWLGPAAHECHDALWHHERMLTWHAERLMASARELEREADRLDLLSAAPTGVR
jgi:hypothetical protein